MGVHDVEDDIEEQSAGSISSIADRDLDSIEQTRPSVFVWLVAAAAAIGKLKPWNSLSVAEYLHSAYRRSALWL